MSNEANKTITEQLVDTIKGIFLGFGAGWVMWVMIALSVISLAIILERAWFFHSLRDDLNSLARDLRDSLEKGLDAARKRMSGSNSAEAAVVMAGLATYDKGASSAELAMEGAKALQRMKLEKRLAYLATLGNNAPFIGLFGTVIGVIVAFDKLDADTANAASQAAGQMASQGVMAAIGEALIATAVGIFVAIPAVAANNFFQRLTRRTLANTEALSKVLLAHMRATPAPDSAGSSKNKKRAKDED